MLIYLQRVPNVLIYLENVMSDLQIVQLILLYLFTNYFNAVVHQYSATILHPDRCLEVSQLYLTTWNDSCCVGCKYLCYNNFSLQELLLFSSESVLALRELRFHYRIYLLEETARSLKALLTSTTLLILAVHHF